MNKEQEERLAIFEKSLETLRELIKIQCSDGNWNYDAYMHGMANGMIFSLSLFDNKTPEYLDKPDEWKCDVVSHHEDMKEDMAILIAKGGEK
jgi:hypothetical protein